MQPSQSRPPFRRERDILARDLNAERVSTNQQFDAGPVESEYYAESPPVAPPSYGRNSGVENREFALRRPSISKRVFRAIVRFAFAVLVGVGATLGWQTYGNKANSMVGVWAPSLSWLLPVSTVESPAAAATLPELIEELKPMSLDLAILRRSLEQLVANQNQFAAEQEQISRNVATLPEVEQEIRQAVHILPRNSLSSTGQPAH